MQRREFDLASLVAGMVFLGVATVALVVDHDDFTDLLRWMWPLVLLALGLGLLLSGGRRYRSARQDGPGDEVGAEGSEDGEVEEAGRGHHG